MKIIRTLMAAVITMLVLAVIIGLFLPQQAVVRRQIFIQAAPEQVYAILERPRQFNDWSPWAVQYPGTKYEYFGPDTGVGAGMRWFGEDPRAGVGSLKIIEAEPPRRLREELDFGQRGLNWTEFRLHAENGGTRVVWEFEMLAGMNPVQRWYGLFLDELVGPSCEQGLNNLKALAERRAAAGGPGHG